MQEKLLKINTLGTVYLYNMENSMKIALVTDSFTIGGGLEHIYQICLGMPDIDFGVFAKDGNAKDKLPNVKIFSSGYGEKSRYSAYSSFKTFAEALQNGCKNYIYSSWCSFT